MSPNDEGSISEANDESQEQMENPSPEEEENADRADPDRDEPGTQEEAQESGAEQSEDATEEEEEAADSVDGDNSEGGFLDGIAIDMFTSLTGWIRDNIQTTIEAEAERRTDNLIDQIRDGRYQIEPPSNGLTEIYEDTANWVKPAAIALFLLLGLSMTLRGANYDTAYAAQTGIPKIVVVLAGIAFMPQLIGLIADLSNSISDALIDEQAMTAGMEQLATGEATRLAVPAGGWFYQLLIWGAKLVLTLLILLAVAVTNLIFAVLFVVGPLAIIFHAIPRFSDVAAAWFRGILACFAISVLWALEFGLGYRIAGAPEMLYDGTGSRILPVIMNLGLLWLVWKTPWWVFQWAFHSYSAGGGGGVRGAMAAVSLLKLFKK
ncbi:MAG: hypothetical protein L0G70_00985 [Rubrobacter sp.]|nr:hypothetical protein [Rubrobacter sp.]